MTNTILTDEQREVFIVQAVGAKSELLSELLHKHESAVLAALVQRAGVEAVATCHDDGHWTPHNTAAGRAFNDSLNKAGSCVQVYTHPAPAAPVVDIDAMVSRFLSWSLPDDFSPDCHISFDRDAASYNQHSWPDGTNLLDAAQTRAMLEHVLALHPTQPKGEQA